MSLNTGRYQVILLRHGESVGNAEGYHQGQAQFPLTEKGKAQAYALSEWWFGNNIQFDHIISSPQTRAKETAEIIAKKLGGEIKYDPIWMERDNGILAGMRHDEAIIKHPQPEVLNLYDPVGETGESIWDLFIRSGKAISSILNSSPGSYLIVSHGGLLNMVMRSILGIPPQANFQGPRFRFQNTGYASLTYQADGNENSASLQYNWIVQAINARPHWNED